MQTVTTTDALAAFCARAAQAPYVTIDTEFLRERSYYAKLCLLQMAIPGPDGPEGGEAVLVDPIAGEMDLGPFYALLRDESTVKVLHAARQDLEIFYIEGRTLPRPLFDTQIAAMVCGFGEQVGYETLVRKVARASLDKTSRFTDWSRRPLSEAQMTYALADVTHLRVIYEDLAARITDTGRMDWVEEELGVLTDPATYVVHPEDAWRRIRTRTTSPRFLAVVQALARFREEYAQGRNVPRSRVMKDDALLELASTRPTTLEELGRARLLLREARRGDIAEGILAAVRAAMAVPADALPRPEPDRAQLNVNPALADLLRVLLKAKAEEAGVAQKLIASADELDALAAGRRDVASLKGWRNALFGADALRLCNGEIALSAKGGSVRILPVPED
ncbi:ribonuclease D [Rhodobaculum claviforme]|uniref:Ribonuclease D n=1 Tax=Rhodobaculum claviforme TaxID=1549854 RepID=A0A934TND9_9RHOB|nr:ribonuclease D [Rhodobaculum claviforme]MBK5928791.1 ribonuclease D [Rhodobaculum claviforme]